jgi:hypothetical protein
MTDYIQGPATGKVQFIREQGAILLECAPTRLAPTGAYVCVLQGSELDIATVVQDKADLRLCSGDQRLKQWLHVSTDLLKKLLYDGDSA